MIYKFYTVALIVCFAK